MIGLAGLVRADEVHAPHVGRRRRRHAQPLPRDPQPGRPAIGRLRHLGLEARDVERGVAVADVVPGAARGELDHDALVVGVMAVPRVEPDVDAVVPPELDVVGARFDADEVLVNAGEPQIEGRVVPVHGHLRRLARRVRLGRHAELARLRPLPLGHDEH